MKSNETREVKKAAAKFTFWWIIVTILIGILENW